MKTVSLAFVVLLLAAAAHAESGRRAESTATLPAADASCHPAIEAAERALRIPDHLLIAMGRVESGRRDPGTSTWISWPWTVNVEGQGTFYETKEAAIAAVRQLQARGVRSIDVGCMQVNLMHHPAAFATLDMAFDPQANARYASQFLRALFQQSGDWAKAAAFYHSQTPALAIDYARRVVAFLPTHAVGRSAFEALVASTRSQASGPAGNAVPTLSQQLAAAWGATLDRGGSTGFARPPLQYRQPQARATSSGRTATGPRDSRAGRQARDGNTRETGDASFAASKLHPPPRALLVDTVPPTPSSSAARRALRARPQSSSIVASE